MKHCRITDRAAAFIIAAVALFIVTPNAFSQGSPIAIQLSQPGQPMTLDIGILSADIHVIGEQRSDVQLDIAGGDNRRQIITPSGSKPVNNGSYRLSATEESNVITVSSDWRMSTIELVVRVPRAATIHAWTTNDGSILITDVTGEMQLQNTNGPVTVTGAANAVIAESVNDDVRVSFASLRSVSAASLTSLNGDVVVGLPSSPKVQVQVDTSRGEIASDFEVDVQPSKPVVTKSQDSGTVEVSVENLIIANINGGGPVIRMKTLNGDVGIIKAD
ncbi:MAG: DUF4097 family beta strand repeat-containing protein [Pseudomonadota bacterium]